jgi:hypothetical protein
MAVEDLNSGSGEPLGVSHEELECCLLFSCRACMGFV